MPRVLVSTVLFSSGRSPVLALARRGPSRFKARESVSVYLCGFADALTAVINVSSLSRLYEHPESDNLLIADFGIARHLATPDEVLMSMAGSPGYAGMGCP